MKIDDVVIDELQADYIKEQFNLGMGLAADELSQLVEDEVLMSVPSFEILDLPQLNQRMAFSQNEPITAVQVKIDGDLTGHGILIYPTTDSLELANMLSHEFSPLDDLTELEEEALAEISGIVINNIISTICKQLEMNAYTSIPVSDRGTWDFISKNSLTITPDNKIMFIGMSFAIKNRNLKGELLFLQSIDVVNQIIDHTEKALIKLGLRRT